MALGKGGVTSKNVAQLGAVRCAFGDSLDKWWKELQSALPALASENEPTLGWGGLLCEEDLEDAELPQDGLEIQMLGMPSKLEWESSHSNPHLTCAALVELKLSPATYPMQCPSHMLDHDYWLRSGDSYASTVTWPPPISLLNKDGELLLHATLDHHVGICSSQPPLGKICAATGVTTVVNSDYDPFSSSDLTESEDSDLPTGPVPQPSSKKCKW